MDSLAKYSRMDQIKFLEDSRKFKGCLQILIGSYFRNFTLTLMTFYQNHHIVIKLKSVYKKSLQPLTCQAVLLNKFLSTLERSGDRLGWFHYRKNILGSSSIIVFIGKEIKEQSKFHTIQRCGLKPATTYLTIKENILLSDT